MHLDVTLDAAADAAYVSLGPIGAGEIVKNVTIERPPGRWRLRHRQRASGMVVLDFDKCGRLCGIEVIGAGALLPDEILAKARRLDVG